MNRILDNQEKLFDYLVSTFKNVYTKTMSHQDRGVLINLYNVLAIDFHGPILAEFENQKEKIAYSLTYQRYLDISRLFVWVTFCIYSAAYRSAMRELRFILESFVQSFYLDKKYPELTVWEKMGGDIPEADWEKIGVNKLYGKKLFIKEAGLDPRIYELFKRLSKYVHSSTEELWDLLEWMENEGMVRTSFDYDENLFERCIEFSIEVVDSILYVAIQAFPNTRSQLKTIILEKNYAMRLLERSRLGLCMEILASS